MNKKEERERYCRKSGCRNYPRCRIKWGKDCIRNMGKKIPQFRDWPQHGRLVITGGPGEEIRVRRAGGDPFSPY